MKNKLLLYVLHLEYSNMTVVHTWLPCLEHSSVLLRGCSKTQQAEVERVRPRAWNIMRWEEQLGTSGPSVQSGRTGGDLDQEQHHLHWSTSRGTSTSWMKLQPGPAGWNLNTTPWTQPAVTSYSSTHITEWLPSYLVFNRFKIFLDFENVFRKF